MLRSTEDILGFRLEATDGHIGTVEDFYFDDQVWSIRYLVADTGRWLPGRRVLISPASSGEPDWDDGAVPVSLTRQQIELGPPVSSDKPVSRQEEEQLAGYYGWPVYWGPVGATALGMMPPTGAMRPPERHSQKHVPTEQRGDPNLRSLREVLGYRIHAADGEIGHVEDFIAETDDWMVRYMVVDTRDLLPGKKVLLSLEWIERFSWSDREVFVRVGRQAVKDSPEYDPSAPLSRDAEEKLQAHYDASGYRREAEKSG